MARSLGVKVAPAVAADVAGVGQGGMSLLFNWLSVIIDIAPLCVLLFTADWRGARKYFTEQGFALGAIMNLMIMAHVLFCVEDQPLDVLLVSAVGFFLGTAYTFFLLVHRVVTADRARNARIWMLLVLLCFVMACLALLSGIFLQYKSNGYAIGGVLFLAVGVLNWFTLHPIITCKPFPDQLTKFHNCCMCLLNLIDSSFFVCYALELQSSDAVLSLVSMINASCALIQLTALVAVVLLRWFRSCGQTCCGLCRFIATLFDVFGRQGRTD